MVRKNKEKDKETKVNETFYLVFICCFHAFLLLLQHQQPKKQATNRNL